MKIFNLQYTNKENTGMATVEAKSAKSATVVLQSFGRLNANQYKINSITEIGCNNHTEEKLIAESFGVEETSSCDCKFDINNLSKEDIEKLKLKINEYTGTLYVDRIGSGFRRYADDGHSVFYATGRLDPILESIGIEHSTLNLYNLYVKKDGKYICLGKPTKYKFIESPRERVLLNWNKINNGSSGISSALITKFYRPLGLFYRTRGKGYGRQNSNNSNKRFGRGLPKWVFLDKLEDSNIHNTDFIISKAKNLLMNVGKTSKEYKKYYICINNKKYGSMTLTTRRSIVAVGEIKSVKGKYSKTFRMKGEPIAEYIIQKKF